jgi:hypothetical protein
MYDIKEAIQSLKGGIAWNQEVINLIKDPHSPKGQAKAERISNLNNEMLARISELTTEMENQ